MAVAETLPWPPPLASCSVNEADEEEPVGIDTELVLSDKPPLWASDTSMAHPDVFVPTFWNWSTSWAWAVMNRAVPPGGAGLTVQLSAPPEPEQVTRAG